MANCDRESVYLQLPQQIKSNVLVEGNTVLPGFVKKRYINGIRELNVRGTDVFVITWPKSGTTWMQHMVVQIIRGEEQGDDQHLFRKWIFLEHSINVQDTDSEGQYTLSEGQDSTDPRLFKTHLVPRLLPRQLTEKTPKQIFVARNPKDAAVSFFHFCNMNKVLPNYAGWDEFLDQFCKGLLPHGDWFEHNIYWWERRNETNVLFIKYEDMKKDLRASVLEVSQFLAKSLTDEQLDNICENVTFNNMRKNPNVNPDSEGGLGTNWKKSNANHLTFLRKGIVGDWKNWFTVTQSEKFDELSRQKLAGTGLSFTFE